MTTQDLPSETMATPQPSPQRVAAIDCGTNSLRLLIADISADRRELAEVHRRMEIVRLGQGVDATGALDPAALARTLDVLEQYAQTIWEAGVTAIRMVATSAIRDASNAAAFTAGVVAILGVEPEVITGDQEARLSFTGATAELARPADAVPAGALPAGAPPPLPAPYLIVDIGGGSTEFVTGGADAGELAAISTDIGCVRLTERHLHADPPTPAQVSAATADIGAAIDLAAATVAAGAARTLVGLAGSVTTVAALALGLTSYDAARIHHARIPATQVHEVSRRLLSLTSQERAALGPVHPGRADVIGAGALILDQIVTQLGFAEVVASEHDILDGIAWSLALHD
ncbi:MAG: exopolyphosphatase [Streptosporangiaceae bacterium]